MEITETQWDEYQVLKQNAEYQAKLQSLNSLPSLKDDIDEPMRLIVAMLALLNCEPQFSCCGFNYPTQPLHKTHLYGVSYIRCSENEWSKALSDYLKLELQEEIKDHDKWQAINKQKRIYFECHFHKSFGNWDEYKAWNFGECLHYPEIAVSQIKYFENKLKVLHEYFSDDAELQDTNEKYREYNSYWGYDPLPSWHITKDWVLSKF